MSDVSSPPPAGEAKSQPTKKLPTFRAGFGKQVEALRAYVLLSEGGKKPVNYKAIADVIRIHEANVSSMNPFFLENGFIEKSGAGYLPTAHVLEFARRFAWDQPTAPHALAPIIVKSWFGAALTGRLHFRHMSEDEAISLLAARCQAGPEAKPQLRVLLDFCEAANVITRADGKVSIGVVPVADAEPTQQNNPVREPEPSPTPEPQATPQPVRSSPQSDTRQGAINMQISIDVDLAEMRDWTPERITSFFSGIAQVLAAKNGT